MRRSQPRLGPLLLASAVVLLWSIPALARPADSRQQASITDRSVQWPTWQQWRRVLLLEDHNTRVVLAGTTLLGFAAGTVGSFALLRKRALMGDALSHATLPGIGLAFVLATLAGYDGKSLPLLLFGATVSGVIGLAAILVIRNATRLKEDAALGIVLSVFFGAGVAVLGVAQQMKTGHAAGLEAFIYGKTASLVPRDAMLIGAAGLAVTAFCLVFFKELKLLCFDETFAASRGYPVLFFDVALMGLVVVVTIIGLQAVGLILMVALLVIPACAARFWTEQMSVMTFASAFIGATSALAGAGVSAVLPRLPSGATIVVVAALVFTLSMLVAPSRGLIARTLRRRRLDAKVQRQHLLRGIYEWLEMQDRAPRTDVPGGSDWVGIDELLPLRSWSSRHLEAYLHKARRQGLIEYNPAAQVRLTAAGCREAIKNVHDHRLWELYLIEYADVAPSQVDRDAVAIEHVLDARMVAELESLLSQRTVRPPMPQSPHSLETSG